MNDDRSIYRCSSCDWFVDAFRPGAGDQYGCTNDHLLCSRCAKSEARQTSCKVKKNLKFDDGDGVQVCGDGIFNVTSLYPKSAIRSGAFHIRAGIKGCPRCAESGLYVTGDDRLAKLHALVSCPTTHRGTTHTETVTVRAGQECVVSGVQFCVETGTLTRLKSALEGPVYVYVNIEHAFSGHAVLNKPGEMFEFPLELLQPTTLTEDGGEVTLTVHPVFGLYDVDPENWFRANTDTVFKCDASVPRWREMWHIWMGEKMLEAGIGCTPSAVAWKPRRPIDDPDAMMLIAERYTTRELAEISTMFEVSEGIVPGIDRFVFAVIDLPSCTETAILCPGCLNKFETVDKFAMHINVPTDLILKCGRPMNHPLCWADNRSSVSHALTPRATRMLEDLMPKELQDASMMTWGVMYGCIFKCRLYHIIICGTADFPATQCMHCNSRDPLPSIESVAEHLGLDPKIVEEKFGRVVFSHLQYRIDDTQTFFKAILGVGDDDGDDNR